jgi:hypothetical protein
MSCKDRTPQCDHTSGTHRHAKIKRAVTEGKVNACGTGQQNAAAEPPGFPAQWVGYGALAVLVTLCPVPDHFAHAFAVRFYEELFGDGARPGYPAEALLATRRHFMEEFNNPLGLAYVLYARQGVHVLSDNPGTPV